MNDMITPEAIDICNDDNTLSRIIVFNRWVNVVGAGSNLVIDATILSLFFHVNNDNTTRVEWKIEYTNSEEDEESKNILYCRKLITGASEMTISDLARKLVALESGVEQGILNW